MQRVDIVIAVIAAVALAGSLVGLSLYDEPQFRRYDVKVQEHDGSDPGVYDETLTGPGSSNPGTWSIAQNNLTSITFHVEVTLTNPGDLPLRDTDTVIQVEFASPEMNSSQDPETVRLTIASDGTSASDSLTITIQETPSGENRSLAKNPSDAMLDEDKQPFVSTTSNGTGEWDILAAITSGGAYENPITGDIVQEEEVRVRVSAEYTYYSASATLHIPGEDSSVL